MDRNKTAAVILAAGYSSRMGAFKPTLQLGKTTVIQRVIAAFKNAGIEKIFVVGGNNIKELEKHTKGAKLLFNRNFGEGMFTSIKTGALQVQKEKDIKGFFLTLADIPLLRSKTVERLLEEDDNSFCVPLYMGKKGHPLYIPEKYISEILNHDGTDGLKGITNKYEDEIKRVETVDLGCVLDMDTKKDYEIICEIEGRKEFNICEEIRNLSKGKSFYLIRHGQPMQHEKGKIFLGQSDIPLSEEGIKQVESLAFKLKGESPEVVYTSTLKRAVQTSRILFPGVAVLEKEGLMEMNLGPWDGRYIEEIKKEFPDEFEKRGKNLFSFKTGNKAENFYDLQFRVIFTLWEILKEDKNNKIYIVSHSGVLRCIENILKGKNVEDEWEKINVGSLRVIKV